MLEVLVIIYLTFMDGSIAAHNDGDWEVVSSMDECMKRGAVIEAEMREQFKDNDPAPSTFVKVCADKREAEN